MCGLLVSIMMTIIKALLYSSKNQPFFETTPPLQKTLSKTVPFPVLFICSLLK